MNKKENRTLGKIEVKVTVCFYHFDNQKDRYVFFFYRDDASKPIYKWIYYLLDNNVEDFKNKYEEQLVINNFLVREKITLYICTKDTQLNLIKVPNNFKYKVLAHKIIENDLRDKFGNDVGEKFYVDNESLERIDKMEEKDIKIAIEEKEFNIKEPHLIFEKEKEHNRRLNFFSIILSISLLILCIPFLLLSIFNTVDAFAFVNSLLIIVLLTVGIFYIYAFKKYSKKKLLISTKYIKNQQDVADKMNNIAESQITKKIRLDAIYLILSFIAVIYSVVIGLLMFFKKISLLSSMPFFVFATLFMVIVFVIERYKGKHFEKIKKKEMEKIKYEKKAYRISKRRLRRQLRREKIYNEKRNRSIVTYQQILVNRELLHSARSTLAKLGLYMETLRSLPSALYTYHKTVSTKPNEIIIYNEANFTIVAAFVNNRIIDNIFIEGNNRLKREDGAVVNLHLQKYNNVLASLIWRCQKEGAVVENATIISNSLRRIDEFLKKENKFGLKCRVVNLTDAIFGSIDTDEIKEVPEFSKGFTIVETVVALAVFSTVVAMAASIMLGINTINKNNNDSIKANLYLNNIREIVNHNEEGDLLYKLTGFSEEDVSEEISGVYYVNNDMAVDSHTANETSGYYQVSFFYKETIITGSNFKTIDFTINKINSVGKNKAIVKDKTFKVIVHE